jgi:hypothetical protein
MSYSPAREVAQAARDYFPAVIIVHLSTLNTLKDLTGVLYFGFATATYHRNCIE